MSKRGYDPNDEQAFQPKNLARLRKAGEELQYLLDRGYPVKSASVFLSNHYQFSQRQRMALVRSTASRESLTRRRLKLLPADAGAGESIYVDGFNTIITLEVALSGGPVLECMDGAMRDLAGLRGTYRIIDRTEAAATLLFQFFNRCQPAQVCVFLDAPVSNSGRLKSLLAAVAEREGVPMTALVIRDVDRELSALPRVVTSDAIILDRCQSWLNPNRELIHALPGCWTLRL